MENLGQWTIMGLLRGPIDDVLADLKSRTWAFVRESGLDPKTTLIVYADRPISRHRFRRTVVLLPDITLQDIVWFNLDDLAGTYPTRTFDWGLTPVKPRGKSGTRVT